MSKKVFNVFSILCFALVLCFIGCTELINPKTVTDINLNIDLSKIIKSTRNTEEIQSSVSIGENPTIKVAIYDAKKYNATTNSTDNLDLITEAQAKIVNNEAKVKLNNIPVGIDAIVFAELSFSNGNSTEVMYAGNSEVFKVKASDNKVSLVLMKVGVDDEVKPDDSNPEEIIKAKEPIITTQPESHIKIYSSDTGEYFTYELKITAESSDNGKISYKWQKLDNENWVDIENSSLDKITVIVSKNTSCVYRCVVTNTNENVNGEKTASIYSNEVTVAYVEGSLTSITAEYTGSYELWGKDFTYSNVSVTETYTSSDDATEPTIITVFADESRYKISPNTDSKNAIGYVPYTVTRNDSTLEAIITVPVKYELDANNLVLETCFNSISVSESDTDNAIKIPQYGTVKYVYQISDYDTIFLIDENGVNNTEIEDINNTGYYTATIVDEKNQNIPNGSICASDGSYKYTVKLESANKWFICNLNTSKDFSVEVYPWEISLTLLDSNSTVDPNNISLGTYKLSISNDAYSTSQNLPSATFSCSVNDINIITYDQLEIDDNFTKGKITASIKINEKEVEVASLEISRENTSVTYAEGLTCDVQDDTVTLYISSAKGLATFGDIVNGTLTENISVRYNDTSTSRRDFSAYDPQLNINAELENDIDLNNVSWTPIGKNSTDGYKGTFDGAKHEIKGLIINSSDTNNPQGLFCSVYGGTVKNLVVQGSITSSCYTGGITGYLNGGTIENCVNNVEINNSATNGTTGGIVGYVENSTATIKNCVNMAKVVSTKSTVGGIVGATGDTSNVSISKCINMGEISALSIVAGILGLAYPITIENCINLGKVISTSNMLAAGIVIPSGDDVSVTVTNCINAGNVVTQNGRVGAISTSTNGTYTNNYYDSTINSNVLDSDINGITGKLTTNLIGSNLSLNGISEDQWSFADNRYPLPDIAGSIPGGENGEIWNDVIEAATPKNTSTSGGGISLNEISSWDELVTKIDDDTTTTEFIIMNDLTATSTITVSKPVKITSDKNVTITRGNSIDGANFEGAFFRVESAGNLELEGKENSTITLDGGNANKSPILATAPLITSSGNLTLTNCTLQNNKNTSDTPGGAINISAGTFTMNGGIIGEEITESDGKQSWQYAATDSDFSNYAYAGGGGIYVASGDVTINGGKISYNYTRNPENDCLGKTPENTAHGGGISIEEGSLSLINSEVSYNSGYQGGGIRCYNDGTSNTGTLTLNKTLIKGNTSNPYRGSSFGGGLMVNNFNVTFAETTESTIEQNYSGDGGALFLENTTSTLKNITIQNNSYKPNGYHYGSELLLWANANVSIDDSNVNIASTEVETRGIFINNNANTLKLSGDAKLDAPVYLMSGTTVTVAGYLSSNTPPVATITPEKYEEGTQVLTADDATLLAQSVGKFVLSDETYSIGNDGKIASNQSSATSLTQDYLKNNVKTNTSGDSYYELVAGEYCVSANLTLEYPIQINARDGEVKLYADEDYTISCAEYFDNSANSAMIALPMSTGTLTLGGGEGTLTIDGTTNSTTNLDYLVMSSGTFNLSNNVTITNGNVNFGAVYIGGGTFNMTGGEIKYNKATQSSYSGIYVLGNINITGGSICDNYVEETNNGASIYNNKTDEITVLDQKISANGGHFTKNIIDGEVKDVTTSGGGNESLIEGAYYVSAYGNDSNDGLTAEKPLLKLSSAIEKANNNSDSKTVYVIGELVGDEASYSGFYISKDVGTNDSPINIIGYPDEIDDVLTVGVNAGRRVVYVDSYSYITFKDLTITGGNVNQSGSAMNLTNCTVTLDNVTIKGNSSSSSCTFGSDTYYSDGIEVGSNCTLNIIKSSINNNIRVNGASNSPADVTIGTECYVSNIYLVSDSSTCTFDSNMKIDGRVYICSTSAKPPVPAIYLSSSLSNYSSDNGIMITYEDCSKVVNVQLISLKDGANFNLSEEVKKFTLSDADYTISDEGIVVQNSGGYSQLH